MTKHPEDLSARARRGSLDEEELARLRHVLRSSAEARLLHQAGMDFDLEDRVQPGDDALAERIALRVLGSDAPRVGRRKRPLAPIAVAALLATGVAAAAGPTALRAIESLVAPERPEEPRAPDRTRSTATPARTTRSDRASAAHGDTARPNPSEAGDDRAPLDDSAEPSDEPARSRIGRAPTSASRHAAPLPPAQAEAVHSSMPQSPDVPTSSSVFRDANRARREGDGARAIALYETLQRDYPTAPESSAADIPLGMLHAQSGAPDRAVQHFERYLTAAPWGPLAPEALFGLAQAHASAGRSADARRVWTDLLARFPDSAYAGAARAKLQGSP